MLDYPVLAQKLSEEMTFRGHGVRDLSRQWGVSAMSISNARRGKGMSAEMLCRVCMYTGDNPLTFWREPGLSYSGMEGNR